jgi:hypothetical protein
VLISRTTPYDFSGFAGNRALIFPDVMTMTIARNVVVPHLMRFGWSSNGGRSDKQVHFSVLLEI